MNNQKKNTQKYLSKKLFFFPNMHRKKNQKREKKLQVPTGASLEADI